MGRVALVTGGNRGIGLAVARRLQADGHTVVVTSRSGEAPEGLVGRAVRRHRPGLGRCRLRPDRGRGRPGRGARRQRGDHPRHAAAADVGGRLRRVARHQPHRRLPGRQAGAQGDAARPLGPDRSSSPRWSGCSGSAGQANYAASKAGLVGLARSLARELGSRSITANVVAPGFVDTDMTAELTDDAADDDPRAGAAGPLRSAARRWRRSWPSWPRDDAGYISGAVVPVDGGLGMGH